MPSDRRPGNVAHLDRLLDAWLRDVLEDRATAGRLRRLVTVSVLATMLDELDQDGAPRLAFKGGTSLEIRFDVAARASRGGFAGRLGERLATNAGLASTLAACEDTFDYGNKHTWPPVLPEWDDWEQLWNAIGVPEDARYSYPDARRRRLSRVLLKWGW